MDDMSRERRMLHLLAGVLDYPDADLPARAGECQALLSAKSPRAAALLGSFLVFVEATPPGRLEELYTGTFDLDASCHPYVGYHLFGESYERSLFLVELKERYRAQGYVADEGELPDRLSIMLDFLSMSADASLNREIVHEALLPALEKMTRGSQESDDEPGGEVQPYQYALQALQMLLPELGLASSPEGETVYTGGKADG